MSTMNCTEIVSALFAAAAAGQSATVPQSASPGHFGCPANPISLLQITPTKCIGKRNAVTPVGVPSSQAQIPSARKKLWENEDAKAGVAPNTPKARPPKEASVQCATTPVSSKLSKQSKDAGKGVRNAPATSSQQGSQSAPVLSSFDQNTVKHASFVYGTPPRHNSAAIIIQQQHHLRRQNSASANIVIGATAEKNDSFNARGRSATTRYTPPSIFVKEDHGISATYAGSKFIESPSAKSIPLPPVKWLEEIRRGKHQANDEALVSGVIEEERDADDGVADKVVLFSLDGGNSSSAEESGSASSSEEAVMFSGGKWSPSTVSSGRGDKSSSDDGEKMSIASGGIRLHPLQLIAAVATM